MGEYKSLFDEFIEKYNGSEYDIVKNCYELLNPEYKTTSSLCPIFYLFDHELHPSYSGLYPRVLNNIRQTFNLDSLMNIDKNNIIYIGVSNHSTIIYKFKYNERSYFYYSNSGYGIENQFFDIFDNKTACRIFFVQEENVEEYNEFFKLIANFISSISELDESCKIRPRVGFLTTIEKIWNKRK
jgi:hypothetical protein